MNNSSKYYLIRLYCYWMILFFIIRSVFLVFLRLNFPEQPLHGWWLSYWFGLKLDLATAAYLTAIPGMLYLGNQLIKKRGWITALHLFCKLQLFLLLLIWSGNIGIYKVWGTMLNARAISFLQDPEGIFASLTIVQLILIVSMLTAGYLLLLKSYQYYCKITTPVHSKNEALITICCLASLPVLMRGGFDEIPVNESSAYYSEEMRLNHAATNPAWYLLNNLSKSGVQNKNPYAWFPEEECSKLFSSLREQTSADIPLINQQRPNIVLIVLESWSADLIHPLGGYDSITPFFNQLCSTGYLFTNIYSSGRRTDQMFPSVLSGFPSQPNHSLSRFTDKIRQLPMLSKTLQEQGYTTSFVYGGELGFANMKTFLLAAGMQEITGKDEFASDEMNSKWGAHDEYIFKMALKKCEVKKAPFFQMILSLSTHEPFEVPGIENGNRTENEKFLSAASYTDRCLKNYFAEAKKTSWYKNTLFILVADHGHAVPKNRNYYDPLCYHIPLLITGQPVNPEYAGKTNPVIGGQHEIANTLLSQMGINDSLYIFGRSLTKTAPHRLAYLNYDDGLGIVTENQQYVMLFSNNKVLNELTRLNNVDTLDLKRGKAYLQSLYTRFLDL